MFSSLNRTFLAFLVRRYSPAGIVVRSHDAHELVVMLTQTKRHPFDSASMAVSVVFVLTMFGTGLAVQFFEYALGISIDAFWISPMAIWSISMLVLPVVAGWLVLRTTFRKRLRRFFKAPFCYFCEYEIPGLVVSPEQASTLGSTAQCSECGKVCQRIVVTRHTDAA